MNSFGRMFRIQLFGESHGTSVGVLIDGCPPGLDICEADMETDLERRRSGVVGTTGRREADKPEIVSGVFKGKTSGAPLCVLFRNTDTVPEDYVRFQHVFRPGHADFTGHVRFQGFNDPRGSGHFSGRITVGLVAAGVIAKKLVPELKLETVILEAGGRSDIEKAVQEASDAGDSIGAIVQITVRGLASGYGEPFFDSVESLLSHILFSVPGVRGVEFGDGFVAGRIRGSEHNDPFVDVSGRTAKNGAGGINGGITNGNDLVLRVAMKPTSTISVPQKTLDFSTGRETILEAGGRHDACIALRAAVVLEAACACVMADLVLLSNANNANFRGKS